MAVFADLPPEVVAEILWRLPLRDRFTAVELTCKQWLASSRRREAFQTVDLGLWRTTEGAAIASNQMLEHIVVASLGSMFHAKRGGEAYQLQPSPICRICLDKCSWNGPSPRWRGPKSLLVHCPDLEELRLPAHYHWAGEPWDGDDEPPNALIELEALREQRAVKFSLSNLALGWARQHLGNTDNFQLGARHAASWQALLRALRPDSWVGIRSLRLQNCPEPWLDRNTRQQSMNQFVAALAANCTVSHLTIKDCSLTRPEVQQLITAAAANGKLTSLTLSREQLGPQGAVDIANMLAQTALRCLRVELCDVDSQGLAALAAAVARSTTLELLSLSGNVSPPWDDVALKLLAQAVEQSPSLQHLSMPELAPAATAGAQWLVQALRQQRFTKRSETSMLGYSTFHTSAVYSKARGRVVY